MRKGRLAPAIHRGFRGEPQGAILGLSGARVRIRGYAAVRKNTPRMADLRRFRAHEGGTNPALDALVADGLHRRDGLEAISLLS